MERPQEILCVYDANDVVNRLVIYGHSGMPGLHNNLEELINGRVHFHRLHVDARNHYLPDNGVRELEDGVNHLLLLLFEHAFLFPGFHQHL